jgi:hypothetical protein
MRLPVRLGLVLSAVLVPGLGHAQELWRDATAETIGTTGDWTNKVELADIDGDGKVDLLFANGGDYAEPGDPVASRVFRNRHPAWTDVTRAVFGDVVASARVIKARDVDGDGLVDVFVGTTWQTQSRLFLGQGDGKFKDATKTHLPQVVASIGDAEFGDVDGDGDLDLVLADWGAETPGEAAPGAPGSRGAPARLWLNNKGKFTDGSAQLPGAPVPWSWDLEVFDIDNDYDLDVMISCKVGPGGKLYRNDGGGKWTDVSGQLAQANNNYDFEPIDVDGDGFLDVVTINDGGLAGSPADAFNRRERVLRNDGKGGFVDATAELWPPAQNLGSDDNAVVVFDADSDGDPDFLIGSLFAGQDRLMRNDGKGHLTVETRLFGGEPTEGTLGIAVADLDGDGRLDVVQAQGEAAEDERVFLGTGIPKDTIAPRIDLVQKVVGGKRTIRARVHDGKTPVMPHDFDAVTLEVDGTRLPMRWYGGALWRADVEIEVGAPYRVCATDAAGNATCSPAIKASSGDDKADGDVLHDGDGGCSAGGGAAAAAPIALIFALLAFVARRMR